MYISWAQQETKPELDVISGEARSFMLETEYCPWREMLGSCCAWVFWAEKGQGISAMLLFFSVFLAHCSRYPQGCPLPLWQVWGASHLQLYLAWYFSVLWCQTFLAAHDWRENRQIRDTMWGMDGAQRCWGLCHLCHVDKAASLGGTGWALITGSFQLSACWKQWTEIQPHWCPHQKEKNPKAIWQIKHIISLDLLLGIPCYLVLGVSTLLQVKFQSWIITLAWKVEMQYLEQDA